MSVPASLRQRNVRSILVYDTITPADRKFRKQDDSRAEYDVTGLVYRTMALYIGWSHSPAAPDSGYPLLIGQFLAHTHIVLAILIGQPHLLCVSQYLSRYLEELLFLLLQVMMNDFR